MWTGWSLLSRGSRGAHGHVPVEWTHGSARPLHRVGKHGHLLQHHSLANLDDMLSRESRPLCEKSISQSVSGGWRLGPGYRWRGERWNLAAPALRRLRPREGSHHHKGKTMRGGPSPAKRYFPGSHLEFTAALNLPRTV